MKRRATIAACVLCVVCFAAAPATSPSSKTEHEIVIGPDYAPAPELTFRDDVPKGVVKTFTLESTDSKLYPGIAKDKAGVVSYTRKGAIYIPSQYKSDAPAPLMVIQDANYQKDLPTILDNMIHDRRVPAMVVVFLASGGGDGKGSERGLEYDTISGKYAEFVETEVLPKLADVFHVRFTTDPDQRATVGCSSGAAAAFTMAWFHPELYHRVLSYSGTFVDQQSPENPASPHGAWEYHEHLIPQSGRKPIRIWMEVGENDNRSTDPESTYHNWVMANQRMAAALKAKGYAYKFVFAKGAKHCDGRVVRQTLPEAIEWLWQGGAVK